MFPYSNNCLKIFSSCFEKEVATKIAFMSFYAIGKDKSESGIDIFVESFKTMSFVIIEKKCQIFLN